MGNEMGGQGGSLGAGRPAVGRCAAGGRAAASGGLHEQQGHHTLGTVRLQNGG